MGDITILLSRARDGDRAALDAVFEALYPELRRIAHALPQTLQHTRTDPTGAAARLRELTAGLNHKTEG